jgi:predicted CopG family antitoxin
MWGEQVMPKKLTITVDERVYDGLHAVIGRQRISQFIESLVRPYVLGKDLEVAYRQMAQEETREAEALAWAEATVGDVADETR